MALPSNGPISIQDIMSEMGVVSTGGVDLESLGEAWLSQTGDAAFNKPVQLTDWAGKSWAKVVEEHSLSISPQGPYPVSQLGGNVTIQVTSNAPWDFDKIINPAIANIIATGDTGNGQLRVFFNSNSGSRRAGYIRIATSQKFVDFSWVQEGRSIIGFPGGKEFDIR